MLRSLQRNWHSFGLTALGESYSAARARWVILCLCTVGCFSYSLSRIGIEAWVIGVSPRVEFFTAHCFDADVLLAWLSALLLAVDALLKLENLPASNIICPTSVLYVGYSFCLVWLSEICLTEAESCLDWLSEEAGCRQKRRRIFETCWKWSKFTRLVSFKLLATESL